MHCLNWTHLQLSANAKASAAAKPSPPTPPSVFNVRLLVNGERVLFKNRAIYCHIFASDVFNSWNLKMSQVQFRTGSPHLSSTGAKILSACDECHANFCEMGRKFRNNLHKQNVAPKCLAFNDSTSTNLSKKAQIVTSLMKNEKNNNGKWSNHSKQQNEIYHLQFLLVSIFFNSNSMLGASNNDLVCDSASVDGHVGTQIQPGFLVGDKRTKRNRLLLIVSE